MKQNNIVLIGMPACGKSYIGLKLSEILPNYTLIDSDSFIEKTQGLKISEIFDKYSEDYFRKIEYDTIKLICNGNYKIISIGGGTFENPDSRNRLLNFGTVFYLKSELDVLYNRISDDKTRPLLNCNNPKSELEKLLQKREENYLKADYIIETGKLSESEVIDFIMGKINAANSSCRSEQL